MHKLFEFIRSIYVFLLFIVFEAVALNYYAHSSSYAQAKLLTRSNRVVGSVHGALFEVRHYFSLRRENEELLARLTEVENRMAALSESVPSADGAPAGIDSAFADAAWTKYVYMTARVVSSSVNKSRNFMVLDRGMADGVKTGMAVVSPRGAMVGYVVECSDRYSAVLPVLNTSFRASGKLQRGQHFGSIVWDGFDKHAVRLTELSKYAEPQIGDTVVSTGFSHYFPEGVMIGRVTGCRMNGTRTAYDLDINLAADLSALHRVILIDNRDQDEIRDLVSSAGEQYN